MGKQHLSRDDRIFMRGKLQGTRECMDMVAMVLMDKCGWHVFEETSDSRDTQSIAYLYECLEKLAEEINEGRIKRKHIKDAIARRDKQIEDMNKGMAQQAKAVAVKEEME